MDGVVVSASNGLFRGVWTVALLAAVSLPNGLRAQVNQPPVLDPVGSVVGSAGIPLTISLSADDPDGGNLRFEVAGAPAALVLTDRGDGSAECNWLPAADEVGNHSLTFTVTDDGTPPQSDSETVVVTIGPGNRPPVLSPIGNHEYEPGVHLVIELSASDPDSDDLSYSLLGAPPGDETYLEDFGDGTGRWNWFVPEGSASYDLTFTVTDSGDPAASASETIVLSPKNTNRPPVLSPIGDRRVTAGETLLVSISASDPDVGDVLAFSALGVPGSAVFEDLGGGAARLEWTPSAAEVGTHSVVVAVADNGDPAEVASEAFTITVDAPPVAPSGDLRLDRVRWYAGSRVLYAVGSGARPRETVTLVDADSGALLGVTRANWRGRFGLAAAPFVAPCAVNARVLEEQSEDHPVSGAPRDCGQKLLTRVREVKWNCKRSELRVEAKRAPASGVIDVSDASSGAPLGSIAVDHHGNANGALKLAASPVRVRLSARSGDGAWDLGAYAVKDCNKRCTPKKKRYARKKGR
jgi:hypothetical protein